MKIKLTEFQQDTIIELSFALFLAALLVFLWRADHIKHLILADLIKKHGTTTTTLITKSDWKYYSYYSSLRYTPSVKSVSSVYTLTVTYHAKGKSYQKEYGVRSHHDLPSKYEKGDTITAKYLPAYPSFIVLLNDKGEIVTRDAIEEGYVFLGCFAIFLIALVHAIKVIYCVHLPNHREALRVQAEQKKNAIPFHKIFED